jgi:PAS domain S-box-containing protein
MLVTDPRLPDNPIAFVNDAFTSLTGYDRHEVIGLNCRFLQGPDTDQTRVAAVRKALELGVGIRTDLLNYRKDGSAFWNEIAINPVRSRTGELLYFVASQADGTARYESEQDLSRLKARVEEEQRQVAELQTVLERKTLLLHELDHRIKNKLQVITSLILLQARRVEGEPVRQALQGLAERVNALSTVHRLLSVAGDGGRFDLAEFITDLANDLMTLRSAGRVRLDLTLEPVIVSAGKAAPLGLVINELLTNALKHAFPDNRPGHLSIALGRNETMATIVVRDDGIGLTGREPPDEGFGKTLITMLTRQIRAQIAWQDATPGTRVVVNIPLDAQEALL